MSPSSASADGDAPAKKTWRERLAEAEATEAAEAAAAGQSMPTFLTGLSERFVARVSTEEIRRRAPGEANQMEQLGEALEETQRALLNGYTHIHTSVPNLPIGDQQQAMGDGAWQHLLSPERVKRLEILEQGLKQLEQESQPAASEDDGKTVPKKMHWRERLAAAEAAEAGQSMPTIN